MCGIQDSTVGRQEKIRRAVRRLVSLLDNYLTGERLEVRDAELKREVLDLRELASATVESWHHLMQTPDQLHLEPGGGGASAIADRAMMELALSNLIDNALKYSPPGGPITLRVGTTAGNGWIEVEDHGVGIAPNEIETIFDKFYRGGDAQTVPGAGLGLHLVRRIVREHGGEVGVVSQPGKGSRFRVRLPLADRSSISAAR
jgi:signal transduction histidine kinase